MTPLDLHIHHRPFEAEDLPEALVALVRQALARGGAPPAAVAVRGARLDVCILKPVADAGVSVGGFLAALSRSTVEGIDDPVSVVGVIGVFRGDPAVAAGPPLPVATVFLEWPDGRWWHWRALVEPETREIREETATVAAAEEGDPLPDRLGRWWSLGRRRRLTLHMRPREELVN